MMTSSEDDALIEFAPKLPKLTKNEAQVLRLLVEAGKLIAPLYLEQEKRAKENKIGKEDIEEAAKKDPSFLSPYTVIEKIGGKLIATPYHLKYLEFLKPIAEKLHEAANLTENKEFGRALEAQAKALLDGSYEKAVAAWLGVKPYILDISICPIRHFDDRISLGTAYYQCWVGILDQAGTERLNVYRDITLSARRKAMVPKERIDNFENIKAKTVDVVLISGLMAKTKFVGFNSPMQVDLVEKYGSEITILNQCNDLRLKEQITPTFGKIFSAAFKKGFTSEDLRRGYLRTTALHELAHSFLFYKNSLKNLKDLFPCIYELAATILGLRLTGSLLLKDSITSKQLESMIVTLICRDFYLKEKRKSDKSMANYALGGTLFINYILENGAMREKDGLFYPNFTKIFIALQELSYILEGLLSQGSRDDADLFIRKYESVL